MNGWYFGANDAARERMHHFHRQAELDRAVRLATAHRRQAGALHRARNRASAALHRLADALAPRSMGSSSDGVPARTTERRPVG